MKTRLFIILWLISGFSNLWSQNAERGQILIPGDEAPSFTAESTSGLLNFPSDYGNKWKIIFSHPRDFTPVCSSEILELAQMQNDFAKLNVKLVILSTDTLYQHIMWEKALEKISYKGRKPVKIKFPMVDDNRLIISKKYGMLHPVVSMTKDVRGVFIIGPQNRIEATFFYPMNIGRNLEEIKRTVIALQTAGAGKERYLTPANWRPGDDVMLPQFPVKEMNDNPGRLNSYYNVGALMWFKKQGPN